MKTEIRDITMGALAQTPGHVGYMVTGQTLIMALTMVLLLIQIGYYTRKWVREETEYGRRICRWLLKRAWGRWLCSKTGCCECTKHREGASDDQ